jgi:hypothetical protein
VSPEEASGFTAAIGDALRTNRREIAARAHSLYLEKKLACLEDVQNRAHTKTLVPHTDVERFLVKFYIIFYDVDKKA